MKRFLFALVMLSTLPLFAQEALTVMLKTHQDFAEAMPERPYGDGDISYGIFIDLYDGNGAWRLGVNYSDDLSGIEGVKSVITPQISLMAVDGIWETNLSALIDYVDSETGTEWGDVYFEISLGLNIPLSNSLALGVHARYPFKDLDGLGDFDTGDIEYAVALSLRL